jgi:hypothetical protein
LREGERFALFLTAYLVWRLAVEFLKPVEPFTLGLSAIQWACVLGLVHYARLFLTGRFAPRPPYEGNEPVAPVILRSVSDEGSPLPLSSPGALRPLRDDRIEVPTPRSDL